MVFTNPTYSSPPQQDQNDDISVLLRQIIHHRSSPLPSSSQPFMSASSSVTTMRTHAPNHCFNHHFPYTNTSTPLQLPQQDHHELNFGPCRSAIFSGSDRLVVDRISHDARDGVVLPASTEFTPPVGSNLSTDTLSGSFQLRSFDNNHHEFAEDNECDSEEREEVVVEEMETKQQTLRNQSKRTRAAEVHNLSEKRRRSRINEKMKALQNLIPNSNKTDKASMLDEAIEYLKQLQLQVQMLSLRNGLSLHPMCNRGGLHPSQLSQLGLNFDKGGGSYDIDLTNALANTLPETSNTLMDLPNQCTSAIRPSLPVTSTIIDSVAMPFGRESCMPTNFGPFQLHSSQVNLSKSKQVLPPYHLADCRERGMTEERSVEDVETRSSVTAILRQGHKSIERMQQKLEPQENLFENITARTQPSSNFSGLLATSSGTQLTR